MSYVPSPAQSPSERHRPYRYRAAAQHSDAQPVNRGSWFDRQCERVVRQALSQLTSGEVELVSQVGSTQFRGSDSAVTDLPPASLHVHHPRFYRDAVWGGSLGVAESYLAGDWTSPDLTNLLRIMVRNEGTLSAIDRPIPKLLLRLRSLFQRWHANSRRGSRHNIAAHYDLGNDFFRLFLDPTMTYSCGLFTDRHATMAEASAAKYDRICRRLQLTPRDHVLEIGTGWGGFALHAARNYGCQVTTTTISAEQYEWARERVAAAGLADRIQLLKSDYRDLTGQYDKLVSIEMIEAVGPQFLDTYFRQCGALLKPDGAMMIQAIVMPDQRMESYRKSIDFIQRYIFPGGFLPSLGTITESVKRTSDLLFVNVQDFGHHYAETLRHWQLAFDAARDDIRAQGFTEPFLRAWNYYFSYCMAGFLENKIGLLQIQLKRPLSPLGRLEEC